MTSRPSAIIAAAALTLASAAGMARAAGEDKPASTANKFEEKRAECRANHDRYMEESKTKTHTREWHLEVADTTLKNCLESVDEREKAARR